MDMGVGLSVRFLGPSSDEQAPLLSLLLPCLTCLNAVDERSSGDVRVLFFAAGAVCRARVSKAVLCAFWRTCARRRGRFQTLVRPIAVAGRTFLPGFYLPATPGPKHYGAGYLLRSTFLLCNAGGFFGRLPC